MSTPARKPSMKLVITVLVCGLVLYAGVEDLFSYLDNNTALALVAVSAMIQWVLLRSELAVISTWLPALLSTLCVLLGRLIASNAFHADGYLLMAFGVPVYFGAAMMVVIAALGKLLRRNQ